MLFLDTSATVQIFIAKALEKVSNGISWRLCPLPVCMFGDNDSTERCDNDLSCPNQIEPEQQMYYFMLEERP